MATVIHRGRKRRAINEINMVPFIDVMLVLLIIFMVTAPMISPSLIDLPQVGKAADQPQQLVQIEVDADENIVAKTQGKERVVTLDTLLSNVEELQGLAFAANVANAAKAGRPAPTGDNKSIPVVISADKGIRYETVMRVMDTLQRAGMQRVGLSVQVNANPGS